LSASIQGFHLWKEATIFEGPLILMMLGLGLHMELDQLKDEARP